MADSDKDEETAQREAPATPPWLTATAEDFSATKIELPIRESRSAYCNDFDSLYHKAAEEAQTAGLASGQRAYAMLAAVTSFHFKPRDAREPFGPLMAMRDRRSPIPGDFRGVPGASLYSVLPRLTNPVLGARVADTCWLVDRSRSEAAVAAINAYVEIVARARSGELRFHDEEKGALSYEAINYLRRALQIGQKIGVDKEPTQNARKLVTELRQEAASKGVSVRALSELDLDFGISEPQAVARDIERAIAAAAGPADYLRISALWNLAARAFHYAKLADDANRCRTEAAECLVTLGEANPSAMAKSHWLGMAIAEYQGIPGKRERRTELRHKLIDAQAGIREEMMPISHETDIREIVESTEKAFAEGTLMRKLRLFASLARSADPAELREQAIKLIQRHPLSTLFESSHHDHEGKVIYRSSAAGTFGGADEGPIQQQIARNESMRRGLIVSGTIEPAREAIMTQHLVTEDDFEVICRNTPFIPPGHQATFARGFARFFQGDMTSALYVLVPQLENSLRHVLKSRGHDVTKIDTNDMTQEDRTISSLFEQMRTEMEEILGKPVIDDIERVFLDKAGPYIRHRVAHGLLYDGAPYGEDAIYACWLIFRLCCLPLFRYWDQVEQIYGNAQSA